MTDETIDEQPIDVQPTGLTDLPSFLIVHHTPDGIHHVHRVRAVNVEDAKAAVLAEYHGNTVLQATDDHGAPTHAIGGAFHNVVDLSEEDAIDADPDDDDGMTEALDANGHQTPAEGEATTRAIPDDSTKPAE